MKERGKAAVCNSVFNSTLYQAFFSNLIMYLYIYFSYNWPGQSDGVDYGDSDEVNKIYETFTACIACLPHHEQRKRYPYRLIFQNLIFHRAIFATSPHSSFDS